MDSRHGACQPTLRLLDSTDDVSLAFNIGNVSALTRVDRRFELINGRAQTFAIKAHHVQEDELVHNILNC